MTKEQWGQLRQRLLKTVGQNNYKNWIEPIEFGNTQDGVATFDVPTNFLGNYVSQNFADLILHEVRQENPTVRRLRFAVPSHVNSTATPARTGQSNAPRGASPKTPRSGLSTAPLDARFTFDKNK